MGSQTVVHCFRTRGQTTKRKRTKNECENLIIHSSLRYFRAGTGNIFNVTLLRTKKCLI